VTEEHPTDNDRLTITLKYGGDYAAPWAVIRGDTADQVKKTIIDLLGGLKDNTVSEDWDLATLVASASIILQDRYNQAAKDYVDNIASEGNTIVIDKIRNATSKAQLADLLKQYKKIITSNPEVSEAFRSKRNSLTR
jgi:gp36